MPRRPTLAVDLTAIAKLKDVFDGYQIDLDKASIEDMRTELTFFKVEMQERSSTGPLIERSGQLKNSWYVELQGDALANLQGALVNYKPYSAIHETGGTTYPRNSRWLWIPVGYNRKRDGSTIISQREAVNFIQQKIYSYGIFTDEGREKFGVRDDKGIGIFVLAKSATYKAQLGTVKLAEKHEELMAQRLAKRAVDIINGRMDDAKIPKG